MCNQWFSPLVYEAPFQATHVLMCLLHLQTSIHMMVFGALLEGTLMEVTEGVEGTTHQGACRLTADLFDHKAASII